MLVVDDDRDLRETLRDVLVLAGFTVRTACNGEEALVVLRENARPDVILLDLSMPVMDGATFRHEQRKDPAISSIPVIVFSATASLSDKARGLDAQAVLKKPLKLDQLLSTLGKFC